ncbi:hypothetical protein GCM10023329_44210 [Streptomyces sanyensis]|uniref:Uncharacterized protein n=2 Tax=Streptomyces sanyensis TaxID=568869 RepID=A0ABP9B267_9ACTN
MAQELRISHVRDASSALIYTARHVRPPVLWCPASRCWVHAAPPHASIDPALWRPQISQYLQEIARAPETYNLEDQPTMEDWKPMPYMTWETLAESIRYASGPVVRDLKEILSGERAFRRESAMNPERWLSLCEKSAGAFVSRRDLISSFRRDCPNAVIGERAFLVLAREVLGRDGRFGPKGARGPWGFRARLPR